MSSKHSLPLDGNDLDYAVAMAGKVWEKAHLMYPAMTLDPTFKGVEIRGKWCVLVPNNDFRQDPKIWSPSTNWQQGGPIIESNQIDLAACDDGTWNAWCPDSVLFQQEASGPTPLIAAMRAFVLAKTA